MECECGALVECEWEALVECECGRWWKLCVGIGVM